MAKLVSADLERIINFETAIFENRTSVCLFFTVLPPHPNYSILLSSEGPKMDVVVRSLESL